MPKCVECEHLYVYPGGVYCRAYHQKIKKIDVELPCSHFVQRTTPIDPSILSKRFRKRGPRARSQFDVGYFGPRWVSKYIVQSIQQCGDMSLAYEMLLNNSKAKH